MTIGSLQTSELDVRFRVKRTLRPQPGTCELEVYNLTESHRSEARQARRPLVRVEAGYAEGGLSLLFQGDGRRVDVTSDGPDWVAKVTAGDGHWAIRQARASRSFAPDSTLLDVARALGEAMGLGLGNLAEALAGAQLDRVGSTFPEGTVVHGEAARVLTRLLRSAGYEWSAQDGVLQVLPRGDALARTAVVLAPATGLVDTPEVGRDRVVSARALLIPDLVPGRRVVVESRAVPPGTYRIEEAEYTGDTFGSDWYADLQLRAVT